MLSIPYSEREEWKDVVPVAQDEGPDPVVPIQYPAEFRETMDYFRAILEKDERSERALELTEAVIGMNSANYTVWVFRRACLDALSKDWKDELQWVTGLAHDNPKNYQIWQHRRVCVERVGDSKAEIEFLNEFLMDEELEDAKNYHCWAHRQWVVRTYQLWEGEKQFIEDLLLADVRNNSAWNQRAFVVQATTTMSESVRQAEIDWACEKAWLAPNNESAWAYIRGMMGEHSLSSFPQLQEMVESLCERDPPPAAVVELKADFLALQDSTEAKGQAVQL